MQHPMRYNANGTQMLCPKVLSATALAYLVLMRRDQPIPHKEAVDVSFKSTWVECLRKRNLVAWESSKEVRYNVILEYVRVSVLYTTMCTVSCPCPIFVFFVDQFQSHSFFFFVLTFWTISQENPSFSILISPPLFFIKYSFGYLYSKNRVFFIYYTRTF